MHDCLKPVISLVVLMLAVQIVLAAYVLGVSAPHMVRFALDSKEGRRTSGRIGQAFLTPVFDAENTHAWTAFGGTKTRLRKIVSATTPAYLRRGAFHPPRTGALQAG